MAKSKEDEKKTSDYNKQPVNQRDYYYDRDTTDSSIRKEFEELMSKLKSLSNDLTKELAKKPGAPVDLEIKKKD